MADQRGFGNHGPESPWPCQSDQGDDHMDQQNNEVAHPGNTINTSKAAAFRLIWQFAMDKGQASEVPLDYWRHLTGRIRKMEQQWRAHAKFAGAGPLLGSETK